MGVSTLIIPFVALCILSVLIDKFTIFLEKIMEKVPYLPDKFEASIAYILVFTSSYIVCWRGNYDLFNYLNLTFQHIWEGWILTALLLSGGSRFVRESFGVINTMPQVISNVYSSIGGIFSSGSDLSNTEEIKYTGDDENPV